MRPVEFRVGATPGREVLFSSRPSTAFTSNLFFILFSFVWPVFVCGTGLCEWGGFPRLDPWNAGIGWKLIGYESGKLSKCFPKRQTVIMVGSKSALLTNGKDAQKII